MRSLCALCLLFAGSIGPILGQVQKLPAIEGWGHVTDQDGDCTVTFHKDKLTLGVPAKLHDLNPRNGRLNAPRVLQELEGDFTVQVRVTSNFEPGKISTAPNSFPFIGAGLLIWSDDKNYLRLERNLWWRQDLGKHVCYPPLLEYFKEGVYQGTNPATTADPFFKGNSTWFRLERKGNKVVPGFSHDGKDWTSLKEIDAAFPKKVSVGVLAINTSDRALTVEFDELKVSSRRVEEP